VIHETGFDNTFYYFGSERQIRDWPVGKVATFQQQNKTAAKLTNWVLARMLESDKVQALSLSD